MRRKRDSIEAHLTVVFAALAVTRFIEDSTDWRHLVAEVLYSSSISWSATWSAGRMIVAGSGLTAASCSIAVR